MAGKPSWVLSCRKCLVESTYAEIPDDTESYFLPERPRLPDGFTFRCPNCGHEDTYRNTDLSYWGR
jgi:hypothetical protein